MEGWEHVHWDVEEKAVGFSVPETLAFLLGLAERGTGGPCVLCAGGIKEVGGGGLGVANESASSAAGRCGGTMNC